MKKKHQGILIAIVLLVALLFFFTDLFMIQPACDYTIETNADVVGNMMTINMFGSQSDYQSNSRVCWAVNYDAQSINFNDVPDWDCLSCYDPFETDSDSIGYIDCVYYSDPLKIQPHQCGKADVNSNYEIIGQSANSNYCLCLVNNGCATTQEEKCIAKQDKVKNWLPYNYYGNVRVNNEINTGIKYYEGTNIFYIGMGNCPIATEGDCALNYRGNVAFEGDFGFIDPDPEPSPFPIPLPIPEPVEPEDITYYILIGIAIIGGIAILYYLFKK